MFGRFVNRFTCTKKQLPDVSLNLRFKKMIPILGMVNEDKHLHHKNLMETQNTLKYYTNPTAIKLSSFSIADDYYMAKGSAVAICDKAVKYNVPILVDAEDYHIQNAINDLTTELMQEYNKDKVNIYKTYQCYRTDSLHELTKDISDREEKGYHLGVKLVRGAYYNQDHQLGILFDTIDETHENFDQIAEYLFKTLNKKDRIMIASHNENSIQKCLDNKHLLDDESMLEFAQLMGMSDDLSVQLAKNGNKVYKYVPYGDFRESIPYLMRRLYENIGMMKYF